MMLCVLNCRCLEALTSDKEIAWFSTEFEERDVEE